MLFLVLGVRTRMESVYIGVCLSSSVSRDIKCLIKQDSPIKRIVLKAYRLFRACVHSDGRHPGIGWIVGDIQQDSQSRGVNRKENTHTNHGIQ
ncbi:hypothetical protein TNCV_2151551 [Trichonephila clavipes]|uniref:Uncharacterized protein n=1 Tax=Trichonephila clavipes TaxID=2585209 RepID=A0A8X6R2E1_TRICX|nr:hypothetical protein TNCV_2151551 [Trichonephila clavipes]